MSKRNRDLAFVTSAGKLYVSAYRSLTTYRRFNIQNNTKKETLIGRICIDYYDDYRRDNINFLIDSWCCLSCSCLSVPYWFLKIYVVWFHTRLLIKWYLNLYIIFFYYYCLLYIINDHYCKKKKVFFICTRKWYHKTYTMNLKASKVVWRNIHFRDENQFWLPNWTLRC